MLYIKVKSTVMNIIKKLKTKGLRISIAEMFFTRELHAIIEDLQKQDDLKQESLDRLINFINANFFLIFCLCVLITLTPLKRLDYIFIVALAWPSLILSFGHAVHQELGIYVRLYNYGKFTLGKCEYFGVGGGPYSPRKFGIKVLFEVDGVSRISCLERHSSPTLIKSEKKGDLATVAYNPDNPDENVPFIREIADVYYLRKTVPDRTN